MSPRQLVETALDHREPDRVPLDLGTGGSSSPVPEAYARLAAYFGITGPARPVTHMLRLSTVDDAILQALAIDTRPVHIQMIKMGDDLGAQDGPLMSPKTYRAVVKPYHKELFDLIRQRTEARIFLHTCGSVYRLLPDLIDAGVEVLNPMQVSAADMDTRRLKAEFGDRLSFMGAIDTQHVLPFGTPDDVKQEVERRIADLAPGGGFILAPVHNVQADVSPENRVTMYRHARQVGTYPIRTSQEEAS